jgi:hypothetical protein
VAISFATAPTAGNIQLQTAINDVDARYAVPTGATLTAGDNLVATGVRANFVRAKVVDYRRVRRDGANLGLAADVRVRNSMILPFSACAMVRFEM